MKIKLLILLLALGFGASAQRKWTSYGANGIQRSVLPDTLFRSNGGDAGFVYWRSDWYNKQQFATDANLQNLDSIGFANVPFPKSRKTWMGSNAATGTQSVEFTMKGSSRFSNILALQSISDTTFAAIAFRDKLNYEHFAVGYDASSPDVIVLPTQGKAFLEANTLPTGNPLTEIPPALALFQSGNIRGSGWAQHLRFELDTTGKASFHNLLIDSIDFQIDNINGETYHRKTANFKDGLMLDSLNGKYIMFKSNGAKTALFGNNYNLLGAGSTTDLNTFVYGNNPYSIWTNGVKRFSIDGSGATTIGTALSYLNNTAQKAIDWGGNTADFSSFGGNIGAFTGFDNTTGNQKIYQLSYIKTALDIPTNTNTSIAAKENTANKQNSLTADGTAIKFPTVDAVNTALALKADLASPALTGNPTAPTQAAADNSTKLANTAYVTNAVSALSTSIPVILSGNATLDFPSLSAGATSTASLTLTGAAVGDVVAIGIPTYLGNQVHMYGAVLDVNAVRIILINNSTSAVDLASMVIKVKVFK